MKPKTKKRNKKPAVTRVKRYQAHYLALILIVVLLLEGILIGATTKIDWSYGAQVLDMSTAVSQSTNDVAMLLQPMADTFDAVNQFYVAAAIQLTPMLDMSDAISDVTMVIDGVNEFYNQAAIQMAYLLDASSINSWPATVSGASITASQ